MYLPNAGSLPTALEQASSYLLASDDSNKRPGTGWSSLIGIITAICGNILISFALNTQRYAHIRLNQDRDEWEEKQKAGKRDRRRGKARRNYGTQQIEIAVERARENAKAEPEGGDGEGEYTLQDPAEASEADPLIPRIGSRKASTDSEETVRPDGDEDEEGDETRQDNKSYLRSPIWWLGIALMVVGEAGNFLAYGFAPASIVSPLGVVALVSNCLIAPLLLGERFRWRDGVGVLIAVAGCVTVVLSASDSNPKLDPDKIWRLITHWEFLTYFGITLFMIIGLSVASNKFGDKTILIDIGLVGLYGGYTALSTKGISSLLSTSIWRVVTFPITYLLLAVLIFTAVMQIKYVNRALQRFNATMVIPTQFVLFTLSVIIGSAVLYRDFEREQTDDAIKFVGGCALTFLGVWCITSGRSDDDADEDVELGEEEDAIDLLDEEHVQPEIREREDGEGRRRSIIAGSSHETPQLKRFRTRDSLPPSIVVTPELRPSHPDSFNDRQPSPEDLANVPPANISAIHSKSLTQLPLDPETNSNHHSPTQPPPLHATTSEPVIPQSELALSHRPRTPLRRGISTPVHDSPNRGTPSTPTGAGRRPSQPQFLDPTSTPRLLSRHSVAGLLPGPLMSPLSTSLSAIVADSLRRGEGTPYSTFRRRRSSRRRPEIGKRGSTAALKRHSIASGEMDFGEEEEEEEAAELRASAASPQGRMRSLSATWGEIFGGGAGADASTKRAREGGEGRGTREGDGEQR